MSNLDLAKIIASEVGKPLLFDLNGEVETRPGHDERYALDGSKLAELGWTALVEFEKSLRKVVRWTLENRRWLDCEEFKFVRLGSLNSATAEPARLAACVVKKQSKL